MTKSTFALKKDPDTGVNYIAKVVDEETKNHKETDQDIITGFMPEIPNCKMCPVQSYLTYYMSLSPECDSLWQSPKFTDFPANPRIRTYYGPTPTGHNTLESFVTKIAKDCGLKEYKYTNHSLRVSAINALTKNNYTNKEIMSITGHKSSASLEVYQRVHNEKKMKMGHTLGLTLINKPLLPMLPATNDQNAILPAQPNPVALQTINMNQFQNVVNPQSALIPLTSELEKENNYAELEDPLGITDTEIVKIVQDIEEQNEEIMMSQTTKKLKTSHGSSIISEQTLAKKTSPKIPMLFQECKIEGNITINIQK